MAAPRTTAERDGASTPPFSSPATREDYDDDMLVEDGESGDEDGEDTYVPEGYETQQEYLQACVKLFDIDYKSDEHNILEAQEDLRFTYVDQWEEETRAEREDMGRPCLTINTLPQFAGQVIGDRRINKTTIKVIPVRDATVQQAKVRTGLIKTIEMQSRATRIYDMVCEDQVVCGIGAFRIALDYAFNDVFEQDIYIRPIPNPLAVVWDRMSVDPTGRDAQHCWVVDDIPRDDYVRDYPDKPIPDSFGSMGVYNNYIDQNGWYDRDTVKVVEHWRMVYRPATFAMMQDGQVEDVTGIPLEQYAHRVALDNNGEPYVREGVRPYAQRHLITSFAILEGPYELPLTRLPIIKVSGRVGRVGSKQIRFGLVRWARDPSLLRNYWRSTAAETLAMAPKNQWIAPASAVQGREEDFREAHLSGDPLLVYNDVATPPQRMDPPNLPAAVLQEASMNAQDIKDVTGIQDASLGVRTNEVSGKAIMARQREGDVATITYHDNLNESIMEGGDVINQLIGITYDTIRTARITGENDESELVRINDPLDEASPDLTSGKYDVAVITGPSYTTQRMESAEAMMNAIQVFPQLMEVAGDLIVAAQDWPDAQQISERLKALIPAAQENKKPEDMTPEEQQAAAAAAEQEAMAQQMQQQVMEAEMRIKMAEAAKAEAEAAKTAAEAAKLAREAEMGPEGEAMDPLEVERRQIENEILRAKLREQEAKAAMAEQQLEQARRMHMVDVGTRMSQLEAGADMDNKAGAPRRGARPDAKGGNRK